MTKNTQTITFSQDVLRRPLYFTKHITSNGAFLFSLGNVFYAATRGAVADIMVGGLVSAGIQIGVSGYVAIRQARASHENQGFKKPFDVLAKANYASAAVLLVSAATAALTIGFSSALIVPVISGAVYALWGRGHQMVGKLLDRMEKLKKQGLSDEEIGQDKAFQKYNKWYQIQYGGADILAVTKGKTAEELSAMFNPLNMGTNFDTIIPLAIHALGLKKAFNWNTCFDKPAARAVSAVTPRYLKNLFLTESGTLPPNRIYAAGYSVAALATTAKAVIATAGTKLTVAAIDPIMTAAGYTAAFYFWAAGYHRLDAAPIASESADAYTRRTANAPPTPKLV